jgi:23S rRNA U2552 (ribose-2'-O)-methylase RlmE/FtsJ
LHAATDAFTPTDSGTTETRALNVCMAPGGYTWSLLKANPTASICGITLPLELGGHPMLLPFGDDDPRVEVKFMDITMLATEYGTSIPDIPPTHPEASKFSDERPYKDLSFDIVLCDGQVLRTHTRPECRQNHEAFRLLTSQLVFGLQRIRPGGTFIILLHKVDAWVSIKLLSSFDLFSRIQLFKPKKIHGSRSSFYLVAKNVQPDHEEAINSIKKWKLSWWKATFGGDSYSGEVEEDEESDVCSVLDSFGPRLVDLGRGIWDIQLKALKRASYNK